MQLDDRSRELLEGPNFGHLSTLMRDGSPHTVPVWIGVQDNQILFFKEMDSLGLRNMRRDPRVALSVTDSQNAYRYCTVRGAVVEERTGEQALAYLHELAVAYTGKPYPHEAVDGVLLVIEPQRVRYVELGDFP